MFKQLLQKISSSTSRPAVKPAAASTQAATTIYEASDATFGELVLASQPLVVVDFWAEWCQPCQVMSAYVGFLAEEYGDRLRIAAMDVDENPKTAERYFIMGLPTLLFMRNGVEVDRIVGVEAYETIQARVEQLLNA